MIKMSSWKWQKIFRIPFFEYLTVLIVRLLRIFVNFEYFMLCRSGDESPALSFLTSVRYWNTTMRQFGLVVRVHSGTSASFPQLSTSLILFKPKRHMLSGSIGSVFFLRNGSFCSIIIKCVMRVMFTARVMRVKCRFYICQNTTRK